MEVITFPLTRKTTSSKNNNICNEQQHVYPSKHENTNNQTENLVTSSSTTIVSSPFLQIPIPIWVSSSSTDIVEEEEVSILRNDIKEASPSNVPEVQVPNERMCTTLRSQNVSDKSNHPNELVPILPKPTTTTAASLLRMLETNNNLEFVPTTTTTTLPSSSHLIPTSQVTPQDVLCGRGGVTNSHPGNIAFRRLVQQYRWEYAMAPKHQKMILAKQMVDTIRTEWLGRFLKKVDEDCYQDIGDEQACSKVAQTLREGFAQRMREELKRKATERSSLSTTESR